ncbi:hypothetical protein [Dendronalium sp. ChiSLP03b]|uniref:hypothetical protein n=1 Tax=Dendronalium sp. ChiSLP03b TaxID=3075381 RepID=UPI002AD7327F|nr:hypothetical protein [Dendronalium sp. ChiSLP03b]
MKQCGEVAPVKVLYQRLTQLSTKFKIRCGEKIPLNQSPGKFFRLCNSRSVMLRSPKH